MPGSLLKAIVKAKGKGVDPEIVDILDPAGNSILPQDDPRIFNPGSKSSEKVKNLPIEMSGTYVIRFLAQGDFAETAVDVDSRPEGRREKTGRRFYERSWL